MLIRGKYQTVVIEIVVPPDRQVGAEQVMVADDDLRVKSRFTGLYPETLLLVGAVAPDTGLRLRDRKSTRLNSSHVRISYAVFCLKKKKLLPPSLIIKNILLKLHYKIHKILTCRKILLIHHLLASLMRLLSLQIQHIYIHQIIFFL